MLNTSIHNGWIGLSPIDTLVQRACEPSLGEPPYNLHIELAEYVNNKKANTPREAAHATLRLVNSRNPHIALLALSLLNTLVNQCGYPFHLQIATKEFLNELVKRFPEKPPPYPGPVMGKILEMINEWKEGICVDSRWREDLGNIRDMWRLLSFKGYRFKERRREGSTPSTSALKSVDELENEDRTAQEAKLQELIRRGTPRDLALAQDLMKVLAGANPDTKPNYKQQVLKELEKLESKVVLMNELLDNVGGNVESGERERMVKGDVYDQVSKILISARPKIQKWIEDAQPGAESGEGDSESLDTYLQVNDSINHTINRYEAYKKGDYSITSVPKELGGGAAQGGKKDLIELDLLSDNPPAPGTGGVQDDLMGLFGGQAPNTNANASQPPAQGQNKPIDLASLYASSSRTVGGGIVLPTTPSPAPNLWSGSGASPVPALQAQGGAGFAWGGTTRQAQSPSPVGGGAIQLGASLDVGGSQTQTQVQKTNGKDPFADLAGLF